MLWRPPQGYGVLLPLALYTRCGSVASTTYRWESDFAGRD
jgi:hypothetical protein